MECEPLEGLVNVGLWATLVDDDLRVRDVAREDSPVPRPPIWLPIQNGSASYVRGKPVWLEGWAPTKVRYVNWSNGVTTLVVESRCTVTLAVLVPLGTVAVKIVGEV